MKINWAAQSLRAAREAEQALKDKERSAAWNSKEAREARQRARGGKTDGARGVRKDTTSPARFRNAPDGVLPRRDATPQSQAYGRVHMSQLEEDEKELAVELIADMMATHQYKGVIKAAVYDLLGGKPPPDAIEELFGQARAMIRERCKVTAEDARVHALELMKAVIRDDETPANARIEAQKEINVLLGVDPRFKHANDSPNESAEAVRDALRAMADVSGAELA